ncbi:MAG: hypothetical protein HY614_02320, partial [Candidatus Rokubacteria bacterium]|nr:hypothetical protein [Candidatus Rokubacteria bacterium]
MGTRFRVYLQPRSVRGFERPHVVYVNAPPGTIKPGPSDDRIKVVDAVGVRRWSTNGARPPKRPAATAYKPPYKYEEKGLSMTTPPWPGRFTRPVRPGPGGHFNKIRPGSRAFSAAAAFATVRCVLEIWEHAFGRRLPWSFLASHRQLEVVPRIESNNGWSGDGFIELGFERKKIHRGPLAENFDIVAHETGHLIFKSAVGNPPEDKKTLAYRAHEEGAADLVSLVAAMHFDAVVDRALHDARGKLLSPNILSWLGDRRNPLASRLLYHGLTLKSKSVRDAERRYDKHTYGLPFSGALYDLLNAIYHDELRRLGVVGGRPPRVDASFRRRLHETQARFPRRFPARVPLF